MFTIIKTACYFFLANYSYDYLISNLENTDDIHLTYISKFIKNIDKKIIILVLVIIFFNIY